MLAHLPWAALTWLQKGTPSLLLHHMAGLGDELLTSCVCHELARRDPGLRLWLMTRMPELFRDNPDIHRLVPDDPRYTAFARRLRRPVLPLAYTTRIPGTDQDHRPPAHILKVMLAAAGVHGRVELRPRFHLTEAELTPFAGYRDAIVVHSSTRSARHPILLKDYPPSLFSQVTVSLQAKGLRLVQIGAPSDPLLEGAVDLRGRTSQREAAALLASSRLLLGLEGGLMHLARAVNLPAVIIYGGRQLSLETGYRSNTNLSSAPSCAPCWGWSHCPHSLSCLSDIPPLAVVEAVEARLALERGCLDAEESQISPEELSVLQAYLQRIRRDFGDAPAIV